MDTPRTVYKVDPSHPGSDVAAETAAALAAGSIVFRDADPAYSKRLLDRAVAVFEFADKYRGPYSSSMHAAVCPCYCDYSGYQDELLWGAAWLHKASNLLSELWTSTQDPHSRHWWLLLDRSSICNGIQVKKLQ